MIKENIQLEFDKIIQENQRNFDQEYLNQLELNIINWELVDDDWIKLEIEVNNFNYHEKYKSTFSTSNNAKNIAYGIYMGMITDTDLSRKDPETARLIDLAGKEANENLEGLNKKQRKSFWGFHRIKISKNQSLGDIHIYWTEKKRILKEKYNIDWKTPQERNPDARWD